MKRKRKKRKKRKKWVKKKERGGGQGIHSLLFSNEIKSSWLQGKSIHCSYKEIHV